MISAGSFSDCDDNRNSIYTPCQSLNSDFCLLKYLLDVNQEDFRLDGDSIKTNL